MKCGSCGNDESFYRTSEITEAVRYHPETGDELGHKIETQEVTEIVCGHCGGVAEDVCP